MKRQDSPRSPELAALLERASIIRPVPDIVRARSLARAGAHVAAAEVGPLEPPVPETRGRGLRVALAASVALLIGATVAVAALRIRASHGPDLAPSPSPRAVTPARAANLDSEPAARAAAPQRTSEPRPERPSRSANTRESYAAELDLLQHAQAAYAGRNFSEALALVAEHGRRFPSGRLAEEREALRVRSLARSGRTDEARRAAAAFAHRFPRSVLLPRLLEASQAP